MSTKRLGPAVIFTLALGVLGHYLKLHYDRKQADVVKHRPIESTLSLNAYQMKDVPSVETGDTSTITRFKDSNGIWQVTVGDKVPSGATEIKKMGLLHLKPIAKIAETPLYLCAFSVANGESVALDLKKCSSSKARLISEHPAGYVSEIIRTGYLFAVRCRNDKGMYISLNARCEGPKDRFNGFLRAIRAADLISVQ